MEKINVLNLQATTAYLCDLHVKILKLC